MSSETPAPTAPHAVLDDLFGNDEATTDDPFAQIGEDVPADHSPEAPLSLDDGQGEVTGHGDVDEQEQQAQEQEEPFHAQQHDDLSHPTDPLYDNEPAEGDVTDQPAMNAEAGGTHGAGEAEAVQTDKDYSALLKDFEEDEGSSSTFPVDQESPAGVQSEAVANPASVFGLVDDDGAGFDIPINQDEDEQDPFHAITTSNHDLDSEHDLEETGLGEVELDAHGQRQDGQLGDASILDISPAPSSPVPVLSIENSIDQSDSELYSNGIGAGVGDTSIQSMFTDTSDWLADTTFDQSLDISEDRGFGHIDTAVDSFGIGQAGGEPLSAAEDSPLDFAVPEGWFDDAGSFQYYTPEEREQVRRTMLGEAPWLDEELQAPTAIGQDTPSGRYSPALEASVSENAARRTPNPDQHAFPSSSGGAGQSYQATSYFNPVPIPQSSPYDAYSPQPAATTSSPYTAIAQRGPQQPAPSPYDPYAPAPTSSQANPYAPQRNIPLLSPPSIAPTVVKAPPKPIQRVASTAYDPPFLRPQKSFVRPATAAPISPLVPFASGVSVATPPAAAPAPPPPAPSAPPAGPPRRPKSTQPAPQSTYLSPPPNPHVPLALNPRPVQNVAPTDVYERQESYDPAPVAAPPPPRSGPSRPSSSASARPAPRAPSYSSFDPPLRPSTTSRPPSRVARVGSPLAQPTGSMPPSRSQVLPSPPMADQQFVAPRSTSPAYNALPPVALKASSPYGYKQDEVENDFGRNGGSQEVEPAEADEEGGWTEQPYQPPNQQKYGAGDYELQEERISDPYQPQVTTAGPPQQRAPLQRSEYVPDPYGPTSHSAPQHGQHRPSTLGLSPIASPPQTLLRQGDAYSPISTASNNANPYAPPTIPSSAQTNATDPYGRGAPVQMPSQSSMSPYAPSQQNMGFVPLDSQPPMVSPGYGSDYGASPPTNNYFGSMQPAPAGDTTYTPQQVLDQRPISEDPLGRTTLEARNAPLAVFGFGGVLITAFPAASAPTGIGHARSPSYGYASVRGQVLIRRVADLASESALKANEAVFPGPLVPDPSGVKGAAAEKKKKEAVLAYLKAREDEIVQGLPYLKSAASAARRQQEGKLVLVRLLTAMVIGDGRLSGNVQVEDALRSAFANPDSSNSPISTFSPATAAPSTRAERSLSTSLYPGVNPNMPSMTASPGQLGQLSTMLLNGDKREAALFAAANGLWSHALVISSSADQDLWRDIVSRFTTAELGLSSGKTAGIKAAYTIFSGITASSVDNLMAAANITDDPSNDQWREVVSAVVFNGKAADLACLDQLATRFTALGLEGAARACALLSPGSPFGDNTSASFDRQLLLVRDAHDEETIIFGEIGEYARSLISVVKGQELPYAGLPQLLPYKLHRAWLAAEIGNVDLAKKYCTAVEAATKLGKNGGVSFLPRPLANSLEDLLERLNGNPSTLPANLLGARKAAKPGFDKIGSWIEGRLTKFIAGEDEGDEKTSKPAPPTKGKKDGGSAVVGPFSHFSTISPGPSNPVTRATSTTDVPNGYRGVPTSAPPDLRGTSPSSASASSDVAGTSPSYGGYGYSAWGGNDNVDSAPASAQEDTEDTPHALGPASDDGEMELLNPMAALSIGPSSRSSTDYNPAAATRKQVQEAEDDDDDLGFGNTALSRGRTPKPSDAPAGAGAGAGAAKEESTSTPETSKAAPPPTDSSKPEAKSGWLRGWWGKKEGEGSGPIRAKLGEESSMIFDPELKRWVVKGAKGETALPAAPPPPPRAQTASPSKAGGGGGGPPERDPPVPRANSATPPPSSLSRGSHTTPAGDFEETATGGLRRPKPPLTDLSAGSAPPGARPPGAGGGGGPPRSVSTGASLDDLLSRPPSKRPASAAAKKGARSRYVDVFQPGAGEGT